MKKPVEWHEAVLRFGFAHRRNIADPGHELHGSLAQHDAWIERLTKQIARAKREGKDSFDAQSYQPK